MAWKRTCKKGHVKSQPGRCMICDAAWRKSNSAKCVAWALRWAANNRQKSNSIKASWTRRNPDKTWNAKHPELVNLAHLKWKKENLAAYRAGERKRKKKKRATDLLFKLKEALRRRIHGVISGREKSAPTARLIGGFLEYRKRVESTFKSGMNWQNWGIIWEIDHIKPLCAFKNLATDPAEQRAAFHYSNVQALYREENRKKGGHY